MAIEPRDASTVLAVRDRNGEAEVYMVQRSSRMGFLGGAHVFPGGAIDEADRVFPHERFGELPDGVAARMQIDAERARAYVVGAVRELFEEAGILLARDTVGNYATLAEDDGVGAVLLGARGAVASGESDFAELLCRTELSIAPGQLEYCGHWITPDREKKRFDTRFFVALAPEAQTARHDSTENSGGGWMVPAQALATYRRREIELVPPTIVMLEWLCGASSAAEIMASAATLEIECVLPKVSMGDGSVTLLYPGDDDYGTGEAGLTDDGRRLSRLELHDGLWVRP